MANVLKFLNIPKEEYNTYKGQHFQHPVLADDTLCGIAISDNFNHLKTESKQGNVTCRDCKTIVEFCKKN